MIRIARVIVVLAVIALWYLLPTLFFDDAYITFRYAANLAAGEGFTYNPPERVLGVTTPLLTLLLAGAAKAGFDIETAALWFGLLGQLALGLVAFETARAVLRDLRDTGARDVEGTSGVMGSLFAAILVVLHPHLALTAVGGMETPLYCALVLAALLLISTDRDIAAGLCLGAAFLARPDAILLIPAFAWAMWRLGGQAPAGVPLAMRAIRSGIAAAVPALLWVVFAGIYFGSPIPHSVLAKRVIHPAEFSGIAASFAEFALEDPYLVVAIPLVLIGPYALLRSALATALGGYILVYLLACFSGGVSPFPWYANPVIPPVLLLAVAGLANLLRAIRHATLVWTGAILVVIVGSGYAINLRVADLEERWQRWEGAYEIIAHAILEDSSPGDKVYVGEVGVIGYLLDDRYIIDSSGISSPEVLERRRGHDEADPEWSRAVIRDLAPDYIATSILYLNIRTIIGESWFHGLYAPLDVPLPGVQGHVIFKRRPGT